MKNKKEQNSGDVQLKNQETENQQSQPNHKKNKHKKRPYWIWVVEVFFLAIILSMSFGVLSEIFLANAGLLLAIIIVLIFIVVSIIADMIGTAVLACDETPFRAMSSRKVRGAKQGLKLIKNSAKIASICADVIGDVCGVLSGAAGATVLVFIITESSSDMYVIIMASLISALIAGLTISGKAIFKQYATQNATKIILFIGKMFSIFTKKKKSK